MLAEFTRATSHICLEFYIIRNDQSGALFADALIAAVRRGIFDFLIYDYIGCIDTPVSYFRRMEEAGIRCIPFNRPPFKRGIGWFDRRNHRKFAVIDGTCAYLGGMNIGDEYTGFGAVTRWRDVGIRMKGPAAGGLQHLFLANWRGETGSSPIGISLPAAPEGTCGTSEVMVISGGPHHNRSFIHSSFRMAIAGASGSVKIITPYFVPGPRIVRSLLRAAKRGVAVQILLPGIIDVPLVKIAGRAYLSALLKAGIEVFERMEAVLHAKVMLIDDSWAAVGSANLDLRSFHRNYEIHVIVDDPDFSRLVGDMFAEDRKLSRRITLQEHEARSWFERLLERLCEPISKFL
jgi:cardiolipin synthase